MAFLTSSQASDADATDPGAILCKALVWRKEPWPSHHGRFHLWASVSSSMKWGHIETQCLDLRRGGEKEGSERKTTVIPLFFQWHFLLSFTQRGWSF